MKVTKSIYKNFSKLKGFFFLGICIILISSCAPKLNNSTTNVRKIPAKYLNETDTSNVSNINWKQIFNDPLLERLIDTALVNNLDLKIALQKIEITRSNIRMANGQLLPQVGLNVGGGVRRFGLYTMDGAGNISTEITPGQIVPINLPDMYLGVQASWEIDIWGKLKNQKKAAISDYLSSVEGTNFVISNLIAEIAITYFELLAIDSELELVQKTILKQEDALEMVKAQKQAGRTNELALQQFQANLLHSRILVKELNQQIVIFENRINFLMGRFPQPIIRKKEILLNDFKNNFNAGIPSQLLRNRPDIKSAEHNLQATKFDLLTAKAAFYPSLNIIAGMGFQAFRPEFLFNFPASLAYNTLGNLALPVINRHALHAHFNRANAVQIAALYEYQKTILNGFAEVSNELSNYENLKEMNALKREQSNLLYKSMETSSDLFMVGKATYLEVLIVQQNSLKTDMELIINTKNQKVAGVNLYRALGGGWR
jgi:outer membrane protein, multidrug efflux system